MDLEVHDSPVLTALATCQLFKSVDWHTLAGLAGNSKRICLDKGEMVFRAGEASHGLYMVRKGQVKINILAPNGSERVIDVVSEGGTFGDSGLFSAGLSRLNAEMLSRGELVEIPCKSINACLEKSPGLAASLLKHLCTKLNHLLGELEKCCLRTARQRVLDYLLTLVKDQYPEGGGEVHIHLPAGKGIIASLLDITPETFSRELNRLSANGLIQVEHKTINIPDIEQLRLAND